MAKHTGNSKPPELNTMMISHQDGDLIYRLTKGGYAIENESLSVSVETEAVEDDQFPNCALIAVERHPIAHALRRGDRFQADGGQLDLDSGETKAHGYFTFHVEEISTLWVVEAVDADEVTFSLEAVHDDVNYYDGSAKRTPTRGLFKLGLKPISELWIPS